MIPRIPTPFAPNQLLTLLTTACFLLLRPGLAHPGYKPIYRGTDLRTSQTPILPASTLPAPSYNWTLKALTLGLGTQNYTCASTSSDAVPVPAGATATLFNALPLLSMPVTGQAQIPYLPARALQTSPRPASAATDCAAIGPSGAIIGYHFFTSSGIPTFDLSSASPSLYLSAKKLGGVAAPETASPGKPGQAYGAVDWLLLGRNDVAGFSSGGVSVVYRVETAGGKAPPDCARAVDGWVTVDYAAEYWFYG